MFGVVDLAVVGPHLPARTAVDDGDLRPEPARGACAVECGESAAHDHDLLALADWHGVSLGVHAQVVDRLDDSGKVNAGDGEVVRAPAPDAEEHRVVALGEEVVDGEVATQCHAAFELGVTELPHRIQLLVELHFRKPVLGDAVAADTPLLFHHVEDRHRVALERGVVRAREARRSRADDRHALPGRGQLREWGRCLIHLHDHLAGVAMALADRDLFLDEAAPADLLARLRADEPEHVRERQHLFDEARGFDVLALCHELEIPGDVDVRRASDLARGHAVGVVVRQDVFEVLAAQLEERVGRLGDHHARLHRQMARGHRPVIALDLDETHPARGGRRELLVVAQRRDFEPRALRRPEDRLADDRGDFFAVDPDRARRLSAWDLADMRHRRDL